jgi:hypothetical protein
MGTAGFMNKRGYRNDSLCPYIFILPGERFVLRISLITTILQEA